MTRLTRIFVSAAVLMVFWLNVGAQDRRSNALSFIYIYHSNDVSVDDLCKILRNSFNDARNYKLPTIFYLANLRTPVVAAIIPGCDEQQYSNFNKIISEIQEKRFHEVNPVTDVNTILNLLNQYDFMDDSGNLRYQNLSWTFFINQDFWDLKYNEKIISKLFFALGTDIDTRDFIQYKIYFSGKEDFQYDRELPYGEKNLIPQLNKFEVINF